jgi:hypothetical protein
MGLYLTPVHFLVNTANENFSALSYLDCRFATTSGSRSLGINSSGDG